MPQSGWEGSLGENGSTCRSAESLRCVPETIITTLLTGYILISNKRFLKRKEGTHTHTQLYSDGDRDWLDALMS